MSKEKPTPKAKEHKKNPKNLEAPDDEKGGFKDQGLQEPTAHGDWNVKGRCSDF